MLRLKRREAAAVNGAGGNAPLVQLDNVAVRFTGDEDVLSNTSLTVKAGEFVTLLGPSGCGKSTLLNVTAGIVRPRQGTVQFDGKPVKCVNRNVGYVTQEDTMLPWLTLAANVGLPLRLRHVSRDVVKDRVTDLLASFDLQDAASLYPAQLSGGMKKRGLLARAMIYQPRLLLMDEPFAALDAQMRTQLHVDLRRLVQDTGVAVMFVTHDLDEAALLSERVVVIGGCPGRIIDEVLISLPADRDVETLRFDDDFRDIGMTLHESLRKAKELQ